LAPACGVRRLAAGPALRRVVARRRLAVAPR